MTTRQFVAKDLHKHIKEKILTNTRKNTGFYDTAEPFHVLRKLEVRVNPQLEEVDFYDGYKVPEHDYVPLTSKTLRGLEEERKGNTRHSQELSSILNNFHEGHITFTGPTGSGKTTLLKSIARDVVDGKYENLKEVEFVHFIEGRYINFNEQLTPGQMLFGSFGQENEIDEDEMEETIDFAIANPRKTLFIIDSLDTLQRTLDGVHTTIGIHDRAYSEVILSQLLTGNLLPKCRFITSSREHAIRHYQADLRPDDVIALAGLTRESIKQIVTGYVGQEECAEIMAFLERKSPSLMALCSTPVFLVYTLIGLKSKSQFKPTTLSGVIILLLQNILHSEHIHEHEIEEVLHKLKHLSFTGTKEGRVLFTTNELGAFHLKPDQVTDLAVLVPGGRRKMLLESHHDYLFFSHQTIQETLAAIYIAEMGLDEFESFVHQSLNTPHYAVIRRILVGCLINEEVHEAAKGLMRPQSDLERKREILKQSLRDQFEILNHADQLELYISVHEGGCALHDVISSLNKIYLGYIPVSTTDVHVLGSLARNCTQLESLYLGGCSLNPTSLQVLSSCLEGSSVKISDLILWENKKIGIKGSAEVGKITKACQVDYLNLNSCDLSSKHLKSFRETIGDTKLSILDLGSNPIGIEGSAEVGKITKACQVDKLNLVKCELNSKHLKAFRETVQGTKISELNLGFNPIDIKGSVEVGKITKACQVDKLVLQSCDLSSKPLKAFRETVGDTKISELNLSRNPSIGIKESAVIGQITKACQVHNLALKECKLSSKHLKAFKEKVGDTKLRFLDLSDDISPTHDDVVAVTELLPNVTKELMLHGCNVANDDREFLQRQLNKFHPTELVIEFGDTDKLVSQPPDETDDETEEEGKGYIGPEGGAIDMDGCKVIFPPGAVDKHTQFRFSLDVNNVEIPTGYVPITPTLTCKPSMEFQVPVKVELETWCSTKSDQVMVEVILQDDATSQMEMIKQLPLARARRVIEFECGHFSSVWGWIKRFFFGPLAFDVTASLFYHPCGNFSAVFRMDNPVVMKMTQKELKEQKFKPTHLMLNPFRIKEGEIIRFRLSCRHPENYVFEPPNFQESVIDENFENSLRKYLTFEIKPVPQPKQQLQLRSSINDSRPIPHSLIWSEADAPGMVFHGDVHAGQILQEVGRVNIDGDPESDSEDDE